jgi:ribosomal protein S18 acetylase RimI-like enzyme
MRFEMDKILLDQILFYMENQEGDFFLDTKEKQVIDILNNDLEEEFDLESGRFISLPRWLPNDGYRLMEKFSASLKNPVARHDLAQALNRNKGVFRAFRNALEQYHEIEKMWFSYKDAEMKKAVYLWYNAQREEWGLAPVGNEPDDTSSLVLEDFVIKEAEVSGQGLDDNLISYSAENAGGEHAGIIKGTINNSILRIDMIDIKPEYQGLGLGKTLLSKVVEIADKKNLEITIDIPVDTDFFSRSLYLENFKLVSQRFKRHAQK